MRAIIHAVLRSSPAPVAAAMMFLASVRLKDAGTTLGGNLNTMGIQSPSFLQTGEADQWVFWGGFGILAVWAICLFLTRKSEPVQPGPREHAEPLSQLVTLKNGLLYMIFRKWDQTTARMTSLDAFIFMGSAAKELEQVARVGAVNIWGAENADYGPVDRIPSDAWGEQLIERPSLSSFDEPKTEYVKSQPTYK